MTGNQGHRKSRTFKLQIAGNKVEGICTEIFALKGKELLKSLIKTVSAYIADEQLSKLV